MHEHAFPNLVWLEILYFLQYLSDGSRLILFIILMWLLHPLIAFMTCKYKELQALADANI